MNLKEELEKLAGEDVEYLRNPELTYLPGERGACHCKRCGNKVQISQNVTDDLAYGPLSCGWVFPHDVAYCETCKVVFAAVPSKRR